MLSHFPLESEKLIIGLNKICKNSFLSKIKNIIARENYHKKTLRDIKISLQSGHSLKIKNRLSWIKIG